MMFTVAGTSKFGRACLAGYAALAAMLLTASNGEAQTKLTVFVGPVVYNDSIWMADKNGLYEEAGLDVELRVFPSGSTALQSFAAGEGDIVASGELPSVSYWASHPDGYRSVFALARESEAEVAMSARSITKPEDLVGKVVGTRVGSTGSWFLSEYLAKGGVDESKVEVKNLETQILPTALCGGDIDAFFIWQPFGSRAEEICGDKVHRLSDATGYMHAYLVFGARPDWLASPENHEALTKFIDATLKGKAIAEQDFPSVASYAADKFGMSETATKEVWGVLDRPLGFDEAFYTDFCQLTKWMHRTGVLDKDFSFSEFIAPEALVAAAPSQFEEPPSGC